MGGFLAITMNGVISCLATSTCIIKKFHNESRHANRFYPAAAASTAHTCFELGIWELGGERPGAADDPAHLLCSAACISAAALKCRRAVRRQRRHPAATAVAAAARRRRRRVKERCHQSITQTGTAVEANRWLRERLTSPEFAGHHQTRRASYAGRKPVTAT